jgi:hypothetical protein
MYTKSANNNWSAMNMVMASTDTRAIRTILPPLPYDIFKLAETSSSTPTEAGTMPEVGQVLPEEDRVSLAEQCLQRARDYLMLNDPMQASEKLYKAAEESIKYLAENYQVPQLERAKQATTWWTHLLTQAAETLSRDQRLDKEIAKSWEAAIFVHIQGFHENALDTQSVQDRVPVIQHLVEKAKEEKDARRSGNP